MRAIDLGISYKALGDFSDAYNAQTEELAEKIRQPMITTAQDIIKIYARAFAKFEQQNKNKGIESEEFPSLRLSNTRLAKRLRLSTRTIKRHIHKLLSVGFLTKKVFHGSKAQYEVWIKEDILFPGEVFTLEELDKTIAELEGVAPESGTSCPHSIISFTRTILINNTDVGKLIDKNLKSGEDFLFQDSFTHEKLEPQKHSAQEENSALLVEKKLEHVTGGAGPGEISTEACHYRDMFWEQAKKVLYRAIEFSVNDEAQAKRYINPYYADVTGERLSAVHSIYLARLELVRKYLDKDPHNRFVPSPYHYFNVNNEKGFRGTKVWYQKHKERKEQAEKEAILKSILGAFIHACNNPKPVNSLLEVFRECEAQVKKIGSRKLLESFYRKASKVSPTPFQRC